MEMGYLREFIVFSSHMNVSKAARALHVSQPTLSHHIQALEKYFGVPLVNREGGLKLTNAGRVLVEEAAGIDMRFNMMIAKVKAAAQISTELVIAHNANSSAPYISLTSFVKRYAQSHPDVYVSLEEAHGSTARAILDSSDVDCVAVYVCPIGSDLESGVVYERIPNAAPNRMCLWVNEENPLAQKSSLHWDDLQDIDYPMPVSHFRLWGASTHELLAKHGIRAHFGTSSQYYGNYIASASISEVQLYDESSSDQLLTGGHHVLIPIDEPDAFSYCYLAYLPEKKTEALESLLDYLHEIPGHDSRVEII